MEEKAILQEFIAGVSHEFKTPLASLTASLEILWDEDDHLSKHERRELLKSLRLSVTNLQLLVDNLLDSANIQADQFIINPQSVSVTELIVPALYIIQPLLDRRNQTLTYHMPLGIPFVYADMIRIRQVLLNLLVNASKYSAFGSVISIDVELIEVRVIRISIKDHGEGIPDHDRERIFHEFTRLDNGKSNDQTGLGMGLAVVKAIVEAHQGQCGVQNREGGGASFWFTLRGVDDENPRG